jgi:hypothetical protein
MELLELHDFELPFEGVYQAMSDGAGTIVRQLYGKLPAPKPPYRSFFQIAGANSSHIVTVDGLRGVHTTSSNSHQPWLHHKKILSKLLGGYTVIILPCFATRELAARMWDAVMFEWTG